MKALYLLLLLAFLTGCNTTGQVSNVREATLAISYGDTKQKVLELLGPPGDRIFKEQYEAWQYCSTGFSADTYSTVWFESGTVTGIASQNAYWVDGFCSQAFPAIDWGQRPADKKIDINISNN